MQIFTKRILTSIYKSVFTLIHFFTKIVALPKPPEKSFALIAPQHSNKKESFSGLFELLFVFKNTNKKNKQNKQFFKVNDSNRSLKLDQFPCFRFVISFIYV